MKNAFITEAETVNAGTKFITRNITQQIMLCLSSEMGGTGHREMVCLVKIQGRDAHPERVWASPVARRSAVKRRLSCLHRSVLPGLCLPLAQYLIPFSTPGLPWDPYPGCTRTAQPRWISKWRLLGGARIIMAWRYPDFWPGVIPTFGLQGAFLRMCRVSLVPKEGE